MRYAPIVLDSTARSLVADLSTAVTANSVRVVVCYIDRVANTEQPERSSTELSQVTSGTDITICPPPDDINISREIFYFSANNTDTSTAQLRVFILEGAIGYRVSTKTLGPNDTVWFSACGGWGSG